MTRKMMAAWLVVVLICGCSTGRDMTSSKYLPEWENKVFRFPSPSDMSGGYWAARTAQKISSGVGKVLLIPFALVGNLVMNTYYVPTWPFRWLLKGDKRMIVWYPVFTAGTDVGSDYFSGEWNHKLS